MKHSSIQVSPQMRARLAGYKQPGMSYEDVLGALLDAIPPDEFLARRERAGEWGRAALRMGVGARDHSEEARRLEDARVSAMEPGMRMEEAFRLFQLFGAPS